MADELEKLKEKVRKDPNSKLFVPLAEMYRKAGMLEEAIGELKEGLERQPSYMSARVALGKIYMEKQMKAEAREEFAKVVDSIPNNLFAQKKLAEVSLELGDRLAAGRALRAVIKLNPMDEEAISMLAGIDSPSPEAISPAPAFEPEAVAGAAVAEGNFTPAPAASGGETAAEDVYQLPEEETAAEAPAPLETLQDDFTIPTEEPTGATFEALDEPEEIPGFDLSEAPGMPETFETPPSPEAFETSEASGTPEVEISPEFETSEESDSTEAPEAVEAVETSEASRVPEVETTPEFEISEGSDVPEAPEVVDAVEAPETIDISQTVDAPEVLEAVEAFDAPEALDTPEIPAPGGGRWLESGETTSFASIAQKAMAQEEAGRLSLRDVECSVESADAFVAGGDYGPALFILSRLSEAEPGNRVVLQRKEELKTLIRLLGKRGEVLRYGLSSFLERTQKRRNEFFGNS
jgi:tetratricopeptide (TPR) repeat protein